MYGSHSQLGRGLISDIGQDSSEEESITYQSTPSSDFEGRQVKVQAHRNFLWNSLVSILSVSLVALFIVAASVKQAAKSTDAPSVYTSSNTATTTIDTVPPHTPPILSVTASNEYGVFSAPYPWLNDIEGSQIVEPYKLTTLTLSGAAVESGQFAFRWSILAADNPKSYIDETITHYSQRTVTFKELKNYNITITVYPVSNSSGEVIQTYSTLLIAKYVKRELRALTIRDRENFLNAAAMMWKYNSADGLENFGVGYTSMEKFAAIHSLASNDIMCDGFHEGSGFLTHHLALTNTFEASLRAIDPSVTLPYWDFTVEGEEVSIRGERPSYMKEITPVFSDTWFGSVDENNHIVDSRWAHSKIPRQRDASSGVRNSYGFLRSYWNNNPDPEVSRMLFSTCGVEAVNKMIPSCSSHLSILQTESLGGFQLVSAGDGHGPMHVQIGGVWGGCTDAYIAFSKKWATVLDANITDLVIEESNLAVADWKWGTVAPRRIMVETMIMGEYFHIYRSLWRSHMCAADATPKLLVCPERCAADVPFEKCYCKVDSLVSGDTTWENLLPCVLNKEESRDLFLYMMPEEMLKDLVYMMATSSVQEGEMIESASNTDILFWLIHPAIERLLSAKRLPGVTHMGSQPINKWATEDWLSYSFYSFESGSNKHFSDMDYICVGHGASDPVLPKTLPFTTAIQNGADLDKDGVVTNWEFYLALDPNVQERNDYVFDNFAWDHCS